MRYIGFALVVAASMVGIGCAGESDSTGKKPTTAVKVTESIDELTAVVGAEGGIIAGNAQGRFAGLQITIPAGALAADTTVRITPDDEDTTPMPDLAERVGARFAISSDAALKSPMSVALPVDATQRALMGGAAGDVKVWLRDGEGFVLVEPEATSEFSVTIEMTKFTSVAAGVKVSVNFSSLCKKFPAIPCAPTSGCNGGAGFCVTTIAAAEPTLGFAASLVSDGFLFVSSFNGSPKTRKIRLLDGVATSTPAAYNGLSVFDSGGNLWTTFKRLRFDGTAPVSYTIPPRAGTQSGNASFLVRTADGAAVAVRSVLPNPVGNVIQPEKMEILPLGLDGSVGAGALVNTPIQGPVKLVATNPVANGRLWMLALGKARSGNTTNDNFGNGFTPFDGGLLDVSLDGTVLRTISNPNTDPFAVFVDGQDGGGDLLPSAIAATATEVTIAPGNPLVGAALYRIKPTDTAAPAISHMGIPTSVSGFAARQAFDASGNLWLITPSGAESSQLWFVPAGAQDAVAVPLDRRPIEISTDGATAIVTVVATSGNQGRSFLRVVPPT